ncbi:MAG: APC family permease [Candidatus Saganbacteria bacterium]|nr:APC family permease [Candidatus Saganbacteria bacterium]
MEKTSLLGRVKRFFIGEARNPLDQSVFHNISLIAFFAWVGLGSDGLSSSCYGPAEAFMALGQHHYLALIIALATTFTIIIISESYSQVIERFPTGGGGYMVASQLLSPALGMIAGCALIIDYILTITISIASGADALFSFLPPFFLSYKLVAAAVILGVLIVLNLRGVKESVSVLMPIFLVFILTHAFILIYALAANVFNLPAVAAATVVDVRASVSEVGWLGLLIVLMRAYSLGAGTYTGIEAVSNGVPILRDPKVKTAKETMRYMVISLASVVFGLILAYTLYKIEPQAGKTLNAVLFDRVAGGWGIWGYGLVLLSLISEAAILFVAAQTGFLGGPRVLANMAADHWAPKRFSLLSDRLVSMNGVLIMGIGAAIILVASNGSVGFLVILYSINVFITFFLAQLGMVRHWWDSRATVSSWLRKLSVVGLALIVTGFILISVTVIKFHEGGWITLFITGMLVLVMSIIRINYKAHNLQISKLEPLVEEIESSQPVKFIPVQPASQFDPAEKTAIILVKDFTGIGLKTLQAIFRSFGPVFKNFVFVQVGLIDAAALRGSAEVDKVKKKVRNEVSRYVNLMRRHGYHAEGVGLFGIDTVEEVAAAAQKLKQTYPNSTFFGGQIVFAKNSLMAKLLHNYTLFSVQERLHKEGIPLFILPIEPTPVLY